MSVDVNYPGTGSGGVTGTLFRANVHAQTFVAALAAAAKNRRFPFSDPDEADFRDADAWNKVMRDDVSRFIRLRASKVATTDWVLDPASDREEDVYAARTIEPLVREVSRLTNIRRHLALGVFRGIAHGWIEGRREWRVAGVSPKFPRGLLAEWWHPTIVRALDKRQVVYQPRTERVEGRDVVRVDTLLGTMDGGKHVAIEHPECLVTCAYWEEVERLGYGRGLMEPLYYIVVWKQAIRRLMLSGAEKLAHGIMVAHIDANAHADTGTDTEATASAFLEVLLAARADGAIVADVRDKIEVLTGNGQGHQVFQSILGYFDDVAQQLCLASLRPTGSGSGPYGQAKEEGETTDDLLDEDRQLIDEELTDRLVRLVWDLNLPALSAIGLGAAKPPRFRSRGLGREDPEKVARVYQAAQALGIEIPRDEAHRRLGIKRPSSVEDVLTAPVKPDPFGGAAGFDLGGGAASDLGKPDPTRPPREHGQPTEKSGAPEGLS